MTDEQRHLVLKAALLLVLLEGWTKPEVVTARLGAEAGPAFGWLRRNGYVQHARDAHAVRWDHGRTYEGLWDQLMPDRPCPISLCAGPRAALQQELR